MQIKWDNSIYIYISCIICTRMKFSGPTEILYFGDKQNGSKITVI